MRVSDLKKPPTPVDSGRRFPDIYSGSPTMADPTADDKNQVLLRRALAGDESALAALFDG